MVCQVYLIKFQNVSQRVRRSEQVFAAVAVVVIGRSKRLVKSGKELCSDAVLEIIFVLVCVVVHVHQVGWQIGEA